MPISLSTRLKDIQQIHIFSPNAYAVDATFSLYTSHAYPADVHIQP